MRQIRDPLVKTIETIAKSKSFSVKTKNPALEIQEL
jgi:hypothetical protein